jgi:glucose/arabinose dehydrogenase
MAMKPLIVILYLILAFNLSYGQNPNIQVINAFPNASFTHPTHLTHSNDGTNRIFINQQNGFIKVFPNDSNVSAANVKTFLNISDKISSSGGEEGLLGLIFHPSYSTNGYFYINYTAPNPLRTVISRFKVYSNNPDKADSLSEYKILEILQPFTNHNGGTLMFGLDGNLYIGMGDGGSAGDPNNNAQNVQVLLEKCSELI